MRLADRDCVSLPLRVWLEDVEKLAESVCVARFKVNVLLIVKLVDGENVMTLETDTVGEREKLGDTVWNPVAESEYERVADGVKDDDGVSVSLRFVV